MGLCTLEVLDPDGQFHDFSPDDDWVVENGRVVMGKAIFPDLKPRCRYWSAEDVIRAMDTNATPPGIEHTFYTRDPASSNVRKPVVAYRVTNLYRIGTAGQRVTVSISTSGTLSTLNAGGASVAVDPAVTPVYFDDPATGKSHQVYLKGDVLCFENDAGKDEPVLCKATRWIKTTGAPAVTGTLHGISPHPGLIACDMVNHCPVIPESAQPVVRGHDPDC